MPGLRSVSASRSRLVGAAKLVLPLAALVLLSTMFLISDKADPDAALPYAEVDVQELTREPRLTRPEYAGTTRDGSALVLHAAQAVPGEGGALRADRLALRLDTPEGLTATVAAAAGGLDPASGQITLGGGVQIDTSSGYHLTTDHLVAATDQSTLTAPGPVAAQAPMGQITAGSLQLVRPEGAATHVLDFTGGVRLIYHPQE